MSFFFLLVGGQSWPGRSGGCGEGLFRLVAIVQRRKAKFRFFFVLPANFFFFFQRIRAVTFFSSEARKKSPAHLQRAKNKKKLLQNFLRPPTTMTDSFSTPPRSLHKKYRFPSPPRPIRKKKSCRISLDFGKKLNFGVAAYNTPPGILFSDDDDWLMVSLEILLQPSLRRSSAPPKEPRRSHRLRNKRK